MTPVLRLVARFAPSLGVPRRWCIPPLLPALVAGLVTSGTTLAWSQAPPDVPALLAADPSTPSAATTGLELPHPGSAPAVDTPADLQQAREIWRQANERVAAFPRGHIDLLRWEARNPDPERQRPSRGKAGASPLDIPEALRLSLRHRPDLYTRAGMNALARANVRVAYAEHRRDVEKAWVDAVAARQAAQHASEVLNATRVGSELGRRMVKVGNWSHARLMREQRTEADAWRAAAEAQVVSMLAREKLAGLLGVWDASAVAQLDQRLPDSLPALPVSALPGPFLTEADIESAVLSGHPTLGQELATARRRFAGLSTGRWDAWVEASGAAVQAMPAQGGDGLATPPHLDDIILLRDHPLDAAVREQAALLAKAAQRRAMARIAWAQVRLRHASARHAQDVVSQLQTAMEQETLLRYNGMLQSSWELLASARERIGSLDMALQARRQYWHAYSDWQALLAGAGYAGPEAPATPSAGTPAAGAH